MASSSQVPIASGSSETHRNVSQVNDSLYSFYKPPADTPNIQILFFHGLQRGPDYSNAHVSTWYNRDGSCIWPQTWLVEKFPRAHVLSVCYTEGLKRVSNVRAGPTRFKRRKKGSSGSVDMFIIGENLLSDLLDVNVGSSCPIVLVGHSIGGLVIKQLCKQAHVKLSSLTGGREKDRLTAFLKSIKGIFFYSTPHHGSVVASRLKHHFGSHILKYFETLSTPASRLNSVFEQISKEHYKWSFAGLGETLPTDMGPFQEVVVPEASARGTVGNFYSVPEVDHFSICRPINKVLASFGKLTTFIGDILSDSKEDNERATARTIERLPLPFIQDPKYVEFKITLIKVKEALESKAPGRVVTLSGASGQGKTSMARHLALYYQNASRRLPDGVQDEELGTENSVSHSFRDGVVFLTCSSNEVIINPLLELWKKLGYELLPLTEAIPGNASSSSGTQDSTIPEFLLSTELTKKIIDQKILIILDDVHDSTPLERFLAIPGESLKFLITTQNTEIWGDRTCKRIPIGTPTLEEACHILKNHASGGHTDNTQPIQDAMDAIVEKAARHPLVLANVAAHIQVGNDNEPEEWENARRYFDELVFEEPVEDEAANRKAVLYDEKYPRTVAASMKMTLSTLSKEVETKTLLLVASIFESQSTPEVVFKLFAKRRHHTLANFSTWSKRLQDTNFIRVDFTTDSWTTASERTWFLHPLRQTFIEKIEEREIKSMVEGFLEHKTNDDDIAIELLIVYGREKWRNQAAKALAIQKDSVESWSLHLAAIKSFVGLIHVDPGKEWEKESDRLAKQILRRYIYCQELDDDSVSILLSATETYTYTLKALHNFSPLNSPRIFIPKTMNALVKLLDPQNSTTPSTLGPFLVLLILRQTFHQFPENCRYFLSIDYSMERLVAFLAHNVSKDVQGNAAAALANLAVDAGIQIQIGQFPNATKRLVALLAENVSEEVQQSAARALGNLALDAGNQIQIGQIPNATERLVALLAENVSKDVQGNAARVLANLALDAGNQIQIGQFPNATERLVALLAENVSKDVQGNAARALANLALDAGNQIQIGQFPNATERLVALLADNVSEDVQKRAALALANFAVDVGNQIQIGQFPNATERLVALLVENVSEDVQLEAARALGNLALDAGNQIQIGQIPNATERLVALLAENVSKDVQGNAARVLTNLALDAGNQIQIGQFPNATERLVALLAENVSKDVQGNAARALANLALDAGNQIQIGQIPNATERLVALLAENVSKDVQLEAAWTLANLALDAGNQIQIGQFPNATERLVALLAGNVSEDVQLEAARTLANLAHDTGNQIQIGQFPNGTERLVALLADNVSKDVQRQAARTLGHLAVDGGNRIQIGQIPNAIERLVALVGNGIDQKTQMYAAAALANLAPQAGNRVKIAQFPIVFRRLVNLLAEKESHITRSYAAVTLRYLSMEGHGRDHEGALDACEDDLAANDPRYCYLLGGRCFVKANRGDYEEALTDINKFIELGDDREYGLQERGIVRRMGGDLDGALSDLNDSLGLKSDDYERLKHRGLVKFLLLDEDGARADAECALRVKPAEVDGNNYGTDLCLGTRSVKYLGYNLK